MELYAAMVENLDHHVGRLIDHLKERGLFENTLIIFMSDNGAAAEDFYNRTNYARYVQAHYDNAYENMGKPGSWVSYGPQWAEAGSAPFRRHKGFTHEGGIVAPFIAAGAGVAARGQINGSYLTVMDLAPTFIELAGGQYPVDGSVRPMLGESAVGLLRGEVQSAHDESYTTTLFHSGRALFRQGKWKLVTLDRPFDESNFELYDLETDPGETNNLVTVEPQKYQELIALWRAQRREMGIVLPGDL